MTKVTTNQNPDMLSGQGLDRSLLEYLKSKPEERYGKLEAYCDLLSRATSGGFIASAGERKAELAPGQFVASISELARAWKWQRATVRQFIEGLVALGQLSYKPFVKNFIFCVNLQQRLSLYVESADDVLDFCCMQFARYMQGRSTANTVADSYTRYYAMKMEMARQKGEGGAAARHVLNHQAYMFNELATSIFIHLNREENVPDQLSDAVTLLFGRDQLWDWQKVIRFLGILSVCLRDNVKPGYLDKLKESYSVGEITLMDCIFEHYAATDGSNYYVNPPKPLDKDLNDKSKTNRKHASENTADNTVSSQIDSEENDVHSVGETLREDSAEGMK